MIHIPQQYCMRITPSSVHSILRLLEERNPRLRWVAGQRPTAYTPRLYNTQGELFLQVDNDFLYASWSQGAYREVTNLDPLGIRKELAT